MKFVPSFCWMLLLAGLVQCTQPSGSAAADHNRDSKDLPMPADPLLQIVPAESSGISFSNDIEETYQLNVVTFAYLYNGGGVGVIDVNNDGLQDLYFTATTGSCKLYLNEGDFKFRDITDKAGVGAKEGVKSGVTIVDINADGWQDIYLSRTGQQPSEARRNLLFVNNQDGTFIEMAEQFGLADLSACTNATFFDYDNDGDLDAYLIVYPANFATVNQVLVRDMGGGQIRRFNEPKEPYDTDRLYRNNGDGSFTDVSQSAGIWNRAFGLSATPVDFNGDGWLDIYVGNDYIEPDFLYINNRNGTFSEQSFQRLRHTSENTMGLDIADLNNDGNQDVVALDMLAEDFILQKERLSSRTLDRQVTLNKYGYGYQQERNVLNLNNGNGTFSDIGCLAGVFQTDWSWAVLAQDFDNDGWKDIFVTNGYYRDVTNGDYMMFTSDSINKTGGVNPQRFKTIYDFLNLIPQHKLQNYLYRNRGDLTWENKASDWGLVQKSFSNGAVYADLDNDGDLDLVVNNIAREAFVYRNTSADKKQSNWLQIKLKGSKNNPFATGARARVSGGGQVQYQELSPTHGFLSSVEPLFHFGLGDLKQIDKLEVEFPGGRVVVLQDVAANQRLQLDYNDARPGKLSPAPAPKPFVRSVAGGKGLNFKHQEDDFLDFNRERLIPWKLSTPGPYLASGDLNGDGRTDLFVGGAYGFAGAVYLQAANGSFAPAPQPALDADRAHEDAGAAIFDADGDGDLDLFVASGGNTLPAGNELYKPRLYLNDGKGQFTRAADALPGITDSGSAVLACDFDGDGDQDIILGGWCVPGAYPMQPLNHVLQNNGGKFNDVTKGMAPDFEKAGMVRGLAWADLDGDGKGELIVAGEWTAVSVFGFSGGKFTDQTSRFGLEGTEGFWRSLTVADVDGDGDNDLICGNLGLNTRLRASREEPLEIYARDFDGNGSIDPLMTRYFEGKRYPLAYRDILIKQIPALKKKFVRYTPYARATIEDVYSESELESALHLKVNTLHSTLFINEKGRFKAVALPNEVQIAPVYAILATDLNQDGHVDLITAGNDYGQQVETGRVDAGSGMILLGDGKGGFRPVYPASSGFWADKEARALVLLPASGKKSLLVVGNNNDFLQVFELEASTPPVQ